MSSALIWSTEWQNKTKQNRKYIKTGEMAQWLRAFTSLSVLSSDLISVVSTHNGRVTKSCNSSSLGSVFGPPVAKSKRDRIYWRSHRAKGLLLTSAGKGPCLEEAASPGVPSEGAGPRSLEHTGTSSPGLEFQECYQKTEIQAIGQEPYLALI